MPEDVYHADPVPGGSLSVSGAKKLLPPSCPAIFHYEREHPKPPTEAMELGTVAHKMVLGSGPEIVIVDAANWMTKAAKEQRDAARLAGKVPLLREDYKRAKAMADTVLSHPVAGALFNPDHGSARAVPVLGRPASPGSCSGPGWTGCRSAPAAGSGSSSGTSSPARPRSPAAITKQVSNYGYFMQAPFYCDGAAALGLDPYPRFVFVFVESAPPHLITVVQLDDEAMDAGRALNRLAIERYRDCTEAGVVARLLRKNPSSLFTCPPGPTANWRSCDCPAAGHPGTPERSPHRPGDRRRAVPRHRRGSGGRRRRPADAPRHRPGRPRRCARSCAPEVPGRAGVLPLPARPGRPSPARPCSWPGNWPACFGNIAVRRH